jgi:hypothetical protein
MAIPVAENESHSVNKLFGEGEAFDYYAEQRRSTKTFSIRALEAYASLNEDLNMVEKTRREEHPPRIGNNMNNIITRMMAVPKGTGTIRLKAERGRNR